MRQNKPYALVVLLVGAVIAVAQTLDVLFGRDAAGFAVVGPYWARLTAWLLAMLLPYVMTDRVTAQPEALEDRCPPLGVAMLVTAAFWVAAGLAAAGRLGLDGPLLGWTNLLLPLGAGLWLLYYGVRAFGGYSIRRGNLGSAYVGLILPLYVGWQLVYQFEVEPASMQRLSSSLQVLYTAAALLFAAALLKVFLTPGHPCGNTLFTAGSGCFLLCTAAGLPQTVVAILRGRLELTQALTALGFAALGVCGIICAFATMGPDADAEK